jgi:hypothetical protein
VREPYRTLFEGKEDHWLLGQYLYGDEPDWEGITANDRLECLSTGEKAFLYLAVAFTPGSYFDQLDSTHRMRIAQALLMTCNA